MLEGDYGEGVSVSVVRRNNNSHIDLGQRDREGIKEDSMIDLFTITSHHTNTQSGRNTDKL